MNFKEQLTDLQLVVETKVRTFIKWRNTEAGRDKISCYERVETGNSVYYINDFNRNSIITKDNSLFFDELEQLYNKLKTNNK